MGYFGPACRRCPYPKYGYGCKQQCRCQQDLCNHMKGCQLPGIRIPKDI